MRDAFPSSDRARLEHALGSAHDTWRRLIESVGKQFALIEEEWKPAKTAYGRVCLLKSKKRTLVYLMPAASQFEVCVVLGERAVSLAMASDLPNSIKKLISETRSYVEGRGIRVPVTSPDQIATVVRLIAIKTTPK